MSIRTRFAPSPTGFMHVGGVRTALYAWLFARQQGGQFILRIEDTDKGREVEGSIGHIMECLRWLGLEWDEGPDKGGPYEPYLQSARLDTYKSYAEELLGKGFAYPDPYTPEALERFRAEAEAEHRPFLFRDHRPETFKEWDGMAPLRFKVPEVKRYEWDDLVRGPLSAGEEALDDFILIKGDGYPTYNFAHVVDDHLMRITHVMRGEEFIASTPKFLSLYDALGIERPALATLPPILGESGTKKLSKRDSAKDLLDYRAEGYLPQAMLNFLALLGWHPGGDGSEVLGIEDLLAAFDLSKVQKGGARFDEEKLLFLNREWMRGLPDVEYLSRLQEENSPTHEQDVALLKRVVPILKERAHTFGQAREMLADRGELGGLFKEPVLDRALLVSKEPSDRPGFTKSAMGHLLELVEALPEGVSSEAARDAVMPYADKEGRGGVLWPLRYALSGAEKSPDPFTLVSVLGKDESLARIRAALGILAE